MKAQKWSFLVVGGVACTLVVFAVLMYWMDPMLQYGTESMPLTSYEYAEMYSNPGIAKNYSYDAVMVGTSMIENTDVDLCDELFDCNMVRLPYSGGTTFNMKTILDLCFQSKNEIETVYWELDEFQLTESATEPRYTLPSYLYRTDHAEDISYLLNLDIFYHYALKDIVKTIRGNIQPLERRGITFIGDFSKEALLAGYVRPEISDKIAVFAGTSRQDKVDANLYNIETLIEAHLDTEFVFFVPPFSILYWDRELRQGNFDATMDSLEYAVAELLQYQNVTVYFYQGEEDIITNLDNYKDYSHYGHWINDTITEYMAKGIGQVTLDNYIEKIEKMRTFVHEYDFEVLFEL